MAVDSPGLGGNRRGNSTGSSRGSSQRDSRSLRSCLGLLPPLLFPRLCSSPAGHWAESCSHLADSVSCGWKTSSGFPVPSRYCDSNASLTIQTSSQPDSLLPTRPLESLQEP